jgi:hypothetical protein
MTALDFPVEYATDADPARSYCLWDYQRPAPAEDKLRGVTLLYQSFSLAGVTAAGGALVDAFRDSAGPFNTVFGIKWRDGTLAWEFYFYDYARTARRVAAARVLSASRSLLRCDVTIDESVPYFMFSVDFDVAIANARANGSVVHVYVGNPGSNVSSGMSYAVRADATVLENLYFFFDAARDYHEIAHKVCSSPYFDPARCDIGQVIRPELMACNTICIANKSTHDCIYFSGVTVDQLLFFMRLLSYPVDIISFVTSSRSLLDHLLFDVGFDYRLEDGRLRILKSGYYGVF